MSCQLPAVGVVYALDGQSGHLIWSYRYPFGKPSWPNRGAAVYQNRVYFTTQYAYLVALDARTGSFLWRSKIAEAKDGYIAPAALLALNGKIVTGLAPGDFRSLQKLDLCKPESGGAFMDQYRPSWLSNMD